MKRDVIHAVDLGTLIRLYQVGFALSPDEVEVDGRVVTVTFRLRLSGRHEGGDGSTRAQCGDCARVLKTLFEIADVLLLLERDALNGIDRNHEKYMRYSSGSSGHARVVLAIEIRAHRPFEQANDGWAMDFWQEVRRLLLARGCREESGTEISIHPLNEVVRASLDELGAAERLLTPVA